MEIRIPYGEGHLPLALDGAWNVEVLRPSTHTQSGQNEDMLVREAMRKPIASQRLSRLAHGKQSAVILCSDHTRPVPSKRILPHMLAELREGNPAIDITLLIATGCHRGTTKAELERKFGAALLRKERIVIHDCDDSASLANLGLLPSGAPLVVNRLAAQADLLIAEGFIEPHFFAGYSGGRKSVLPGVCARETVLGNHCAAFIDHPCARTGILQGNPIHRDMMAAVGMAKLAYIVNVVIDSEKRVTAAFAGCPEKAHAAGCAHLDGHCRVSPQRPGDVVITSNGGAPLDQNLYQAVKGLTAAEAAAAPGAVLILAATCGDGTGGEDFYNCLKDCDSPSTLLHSIRKVSMDRTAPDQWQAQILARVMEKHRVILLCAPEVQKAAGEMKFETASSLDEALDMALKEKGAKARITVIPDGVSVIVQ